MFFFKRYDYNRYLHGMTNLCLTQRSSALHHARGEVAERGRDVQAVHQRRARQHDEQPDDDEQLALAIAADEPQQRVDEEAPRQHQPDNRADGVERSEEHTSELQSLMRISYAVFCLKNKNTTHKINEYNTIHKQ